MSTSVIAASINPMRRSLLGEGSGGCLVSLRTLLLFSEAVLLFISSIRLQPCPSAYSGVLELDQADHAELWMM
ncbi:uncharacterized protein BDV17DRAFT_248556, partial [Aspergillus undulatus]|uniref:uncharacterized protein n=1 Tax=Aspergillus undulatus TaxID=1810928 RepID=UPI003CCD251F